MLLRIFVIWYLLQQIYNNFITIIFYFSIKITQGYNCTLHVQPYSCNARWEEVTAKHRTKERTDRLQALTQIGWGAEKWEVAFWPLSSLWRFISAKYPLLPPTLWSKSFLPDSFKFQHPGSYIPPRKGELSLFTLFVSLFLFLYDTQRTESLRCEIWFRVLRYGFPFPIHVFLHLWWTQFSVLSISYAILFMLCDVFHGLALLIHCIYLDFYNWYVSICYELKLS